MKETYKIHRLRDKMRLKPAVKDITKFMEGKGGLTDKQIDDLISVVNREQINAIKFLEREKNKLTSKS